MIKTLGYLSAAAGLWLILNAPHGSIMLLVGVLLLINGAIIVRILS